MKNVWRSLSDRPGVTSPENWSLSRRTERGARSRRDHCRERATYSGRPVFPSGLPRATMPVGSLTPCSSLLASSSPQLLMVGAAVSWWRSVTPRTLAENVVHEVLLDAVRAGKFLVFAGDGEADSSQDARGCPGWADAYSGRVSRPRRPRQLRWVDYILLAHVQARRSVKHNLN